MFKTPECFNKLKKNYNAFHVPKRQIERGGKWITGCLGDEKQEW